MGGLRWTHKATRNLALALRQRGVAISHVTVGRLLREMKYSLRTNRKRHAKTNDPDRDQQFRLLARRRQRFRREECPAISIDCKKKEMLGNFKNPGRTWRRHARDVFDHDFPRKAHPRRPKSTRFAIAQRKKKKPADLNWSQCKWYWAPALQ